MPSVGKPLKNSLSILAICLLSACKSAPKIEMCLIGGDNEPLLICYDARLPKEKRSYDRKWEDSHNYFATNPDDFNTLMEYCERRGKR